MQDVAQGVVVKGWRNGLLLIVPPDGTWDEVIAQVHDKLDEAKARSFWRGAQTTIDCGLRPVTHDELAALMHRIKGGFGLVPVAVVAADPETRAAGEKLALVSYDELPLIKKAFRETESDGETAEPPPTPANPPTASANNALYVPNTVRSGQRVVHEKHLIIYGDVNAGAEVMAGGDILVFGTLRGLAHAGCYGDETARIAANSLRPPQLRIASKIARSPEENTKSSAGGTAARREPEVARIENGEIQVFPL